MPKVFERLFLIAGIAATLIYADPVPVSEMPAAAIAPVNLAAVPIPAYPLFQPLSEEQRTWSDDEDDEDDENWAELVPTPQFAFPVQEAPSASLISISSIEDEDSTAAASDDSYNDSVTEETESDESGESEESADAVSSSTDVSESGDEDSETITPNLDAFLAMSTTPIPQTEVVVVVLESDDPEEEDVLVIAEVVPTVLVDEEIPSEVPIVESEGEEVATKEPSKTDAEFEIAFIEEENMSFAELDQTADEGTQTGSAAAMAITTSVAAIAASLLLL